MTDKKRDWELVHESQWNPDGIEYSSGPKPDARGIVIFRIGSLYVELRWRNFSNNGSNRRTVYQALHWTDDGWRSLMTECVCLTQPLDDLIDRCDPK